MTDLERIGLLKRRTIIAMFSDDELMEVLVLKGGNALDLIHGVVVRSSIDLDFSVEVDLPEPGREKMRARFERLLVTALREDGYQAFDVQLHVRPPELSDDLKGFWGGYRLEFKILELEKYAALAGNLEAARRNATPVSHDQSRTFKIDISRVEYCAPKQRKELDGYTIYVYSPLMIACEKIRAICQQMPEYKAIVRSSHATARARDFFDIYALVERFGLDLGSAESLETVRQMFAVKRVPRRLIGEILTYRDFHRQGFASVRATVKPGVKLRDFDFYFDYVLALTEKLKPLWEENPPVR